MAPGKPTAPDIEEQQVALGAAAMEAITVRRVTTEPDTLRTTTAAEATAAGADHEPVKLPTGLDTLTNEATGNIKKPRPGVCTYLMFDIHDMTGMTEHGTMKRLLADFKLVANTADYHVSTGDGFLTILGTSERATNSLAAMAISIQTIDPKEKVFIGPAEISYPEGEMIVSNLPMSETRKAWQAKQPGLWTTDELASNVADKSKFREGSHFEWELSEPDELNLRKV